jgi:hypothetical protein
MTENQDKLFADLDALTEEQIEAKLAAGVWDEAKRPIVDRYLTQTRLRRLEGEAASLREVARSAQVASLEAVGIARRANWRGKTTRIISVGAMLAAMAAALVAFLALRQ